MCKKMKLEVVNICLGCIVLLVAVFVVYKQASNEEFAVLDKCGAIGKTYCKLLKSGKVDNLGDGARKVLYEAMQACGNSGYLDVTDCYPSWATRIGGTHYNPLYPQI